MLIAVAETATGHGNSCHGEAGASVALHSFTLFAMRHVACAVLVLAGFAPPPLGCADRPLRRACADRNQYGEWTAAS
ncbi:hypothetical protein [Paraburkholderia sp. EG304]|uniref:hypothetical protein n=1 Tax=Paraburkholderia sp. EG304 TaxID=3237015 RepID=UPI00397B0AF6